MSFPRKANLRGGELQMRKNKYQFLFSCSVEVKSQEINPKHYTEVCICYLHNERVRSPIHNSCLAALNLSHFLSSSKPTPLIPLSSLHRTESNKANRHGPKPYPLTSPSIPPPRVSSSGHNSQKLSLPTYNTKLRKFLSKRARVQHPPATTTNLMS